MRAAGDPIASGRGKPGIARAILAALSLLSVALYADETGSLATIPSVSTKEGTRYYPAAEGREERALVLVVHGLNLEPERLGPIIDFLRGRGASVLRLTLRGHGGDYEEMMAATREDWLEDMGKASLRARNLSIESGVPLFFVGFSLGALVNVDFLNGEGSSGFQKRVFLSPALRLKWYAPLAKIFALPIFRSEVPSRAPPGYRIYDRVPLSAYDAIFACRAAIERLSPANAGTPTLIFASPGDELVSYSGLKRLAREQAASTWSLRALSKSGSTIAPYYRHFAIDPASMGPGQWEEFTLGMAAFFGLE